MKAGSDLSELYQLYFSYLRYFLAKDDSTATVYDKYMALSYALRSEMVDKWIETQKKYHVENPKRIYYLSTEYVFGKRLKHNILSLDLESEVKEAIEELGVSLEELYDFEEDFQLGNGGKGSVAASIQDSMASLALPAMGYGIGYDFGMFRQEIRNFMQFEKPLDWLHKSHSWEICRPEYQCTVGFGGYVSRESSGKYVWNTSESVTAMPFDFPVPGFLNDTVNTVRFWSSHYSEEFLEDYINHGDYVRACEEKKEAGAISTILFPDDDIRKATEKRIRLQYFLVSAALQDIIRRDRLHYPSIKKMHQRIAIHLNSSKCAVAVPELMRILIDEFSVEWEEAWNITKGVFSITSHVVSAEGFDKWPVYLIEQILPRHMEIVNEINRRLCSELVSGGLNENDLKTHSIIEDKDVKWVKMNMLAALGSNTLSGVSKIQSKMLREDIYKYHYNNGLVNINTNTNGVLVRRWIYSANRPLSRFITRLIGEGWVCNPDKLKNLEKYVDDKDVLFKLGDIKHTAKRRLSHFVEDEYGVTLDTSSLFDVHCNKVHPYKRQILHLMYVVGQYLKYKEGKDIGVYRTHIFSGKASPADSLSKQLVHLMNIVSDIITGDPEAENKIKVLFLPDYRVSLAERIVPAADVSEQLAAPGKEACGTSNMKFILNGAHSIVSYSGSNPELLEEMPKGGVVAFGDREHPVEKATDQEVSQIDLNAEKILNFIEERVRDYPEGTKTYPLISTLRDNDSYSVLLDFEEYSKCQEIVSTLYTDSISWINKSLINIANSGWFTSIR
ncbi:MAG: glycogen/starch/alpha-glucan family phosphorylase, partial [Chitinivibrionales bacterium]